MSGGRLVLSPGGAVIATATLAVLWRRAIMAHRVARGAIDHVLARPVRDVLLVAATVGIGGAVVDAIRRGLSDRSSDDESSEEPGDESSEEREP